MRGAATAEHASRRARGARRFAFAWPAILSLVGCLPSFPATSGDDASVGKDSATIGAEPIAASEAAAASDAAADQSASGTGAAAEASTENDGGETGVPEAAPCLDACTAGAKQCSSGAVQTCEAQDGGCAQWVTTATCGPHQTCVSTGGTSSCTCNASVCTEAGAVCQDEQTKTTCSTDSDGCLYVASMMTCSSPESCAGLAPNAECSLTCTNTCSPNQTSCVSGALATCTLGSNGCYSYGTPVPCGTHQTCVGAAGSASCACNTDPYCTSASNACVNATTMVACAEDAQHCFYEAAAPMACVDQACVGGACAGVCTPTATTSCGVCNDGIETCSSSGVWGPCTGASSQHTYYQDSDGDTFGNPLVSVTQCGSAPSGYVSNNTDCCDTDATANPGETAFVTTGPDKCGSWDYNCDGAVEMSFAPPLNTACTEMAGTCGCPACEFCTSAGACAAGCVSYSVASPPCGTSFTFSYIQYTSAQAGCTTGTGGMDVQGCQ